MQTCSAGSKWKFKRTIGAVNETIGTRFYLKKKKEANCPVGFVCLNRSPSISWRLVLSRLLLVVGKRRLLVACGAAGVRRGWVRSIVVVGWVSVLLVKLTDALAIPSKRKVGQETPGDDREEGEGYDGAGGITSDGSHVSGFGPLAGQDTEADEPQERPRS